MTHPPLQFIVDPLHLYSIFHLNLAYSSIEEEQRPEVIEKCYWPLLKLARRYNLPFGIEIPAYTLESIASIDPAWIGELRRLTTDGPCEFIGSGYSQLIGPIVPAEVNAANLRIGNAVYKELLGFVPGLAYINEQAYSSGILQHYCDAGYHAIVMEWENPYRCHREWNPEWRYHPQVACDEHGNNIPLIWNMSIPFQKLQRYAHGEMELSEFIEYIVTHHHAPMRFFSLYGNDIEVFNFRPGRYHTEADLEYDEWGRVNDLYAALKKDPRFTFISPGRLLEGLSSQNAGNMLHLESPEEPIPVKKQGKYNISRWAVTGRNDLYVNTACHQIYSHYIQSDCQDDDTWRELCYLWSSDFRTHITEKRWQKYIERLTRALEVIGYERVSGQRSGEHSCDMYGQSKPGRIHKTDRHLLIEAGDIRLKLNLKRGLAIEALWNTSQSDKPLICTLPHGYFEDIRFGADFYSGHMVIDAPGQPKITDLVPTTPRIEESEAAIRIEGNISTPVGEIEKAVTISKYDGTIELEYTFGDVRIPKGSFRLGYITLNPTIFDAETLYYSCCNGGYEPKTFYINKKEIDHGDPVSFLVSASQGIGMTNGMVTIGDAEESIILDVDMTCSAPIGLVSHHCVDDQYFFRIGFSLGEMDETIRHECRLEGWSPKFRMRIRTG
ncbi:hypothetical protein [Methanocalculus taiwanensis]|nr:hypothetical protein [Methanocalculus taiwanensis]